MRINNKSFNLIKTTIVSNKHNEDEKYLNDPNTRGKNNTFKKKKYIPGAKKVIVWSEFNTMPFGSKRFKKEWIEERIKIFMNFTLKSLKAQTNQDFLALMKYEDKSKEIIENALKKYPNLPNNIKFIAKSNYEKKVKEVIKGYDYLYLVRLDSDDLYHKTYIQQQYDYKHDISTQAIITQNGYIYDSIKKQMAKSHLRSPSYYTLIYKVKDYLAGKRYIIPGGHPNVIKLLNHEIIKRPNYIRLIHSTNNSSTFRFANHKDIIKDKKEMERILKEFM